MRIRLYGMLRLDVGEPWVTVPAGSGDTVRDVLERLLDRYPRLRQRIFTADGRLAPYLMVAVRGRQIRDAEGLALPLEPGDEVLLFPPGAGG